MFKKQWKRWVIIGSVVVALVAGTVGIVSAADGPDGPLGPGMFGRWFGARERHDELLAEELDVSVAELEAAREAARAEALELALEEERITAEQYEKMQTMAALRPYLNPQALMAEALGVEEEELADQPLNEWLDELDLDREELRERMKDARDDAIEEAVADGVITEEEAEEITERMPGLRGLRRRQGGFGRRGGMRGGFGGRRGCPENAPSEDGGF